ncbi:unnamed protein product [Candidula unifasciata]|uniref:Heparanase n=1 Tax=Candidula unifasciata TaxID=100452 RepID=A0A8S3ZM19_9EUPU|nr:unnamed protein product [Candidula unifasciata]
MDCLKHLLFLAVCCCKLQTSHAKNVYVFNVDEPKACGSVANKITVAVNTSIHEIDARYLSVALGTSRATVDFLGSQKMINMAAALTPVELRLGGTPANFMTYVPAASSHQTPSSCDTDADNVGYSADEEFFSITASQWLHFTSFLKKVNWDLLFDVNNFKSTDNGTWDPTNLEQLLNDSSAHGVPIAHFQLGNGGYDVVDEICLHHYYIDGHGATADQFTSVTNLDNLKTMYEVVAQLTNATPRPRPVQLSETASSWAGGTTGLSDAYVAGFMWLDKLGLSAKLKATRIFRQSLVGAAYALVTSRFDPNPDYFLSLVFKTLVEGPVFDVTVETKNDKLRLYANCASNKRYSPGALVVYYLNVADTDAVLSLSQYSDADLDLYKLSPGDEDGLKSKYVKLNGNKLVLTGDQLPELTAKAHTGDVTVEAKTFGFIVVPLAGVEFCVNYFAKLDSRSQNK